MWNYFGDMGRLLLIKDKLESSNTHFLMGGLTVASSRPRARLTMAPYYPDHNAINGESGGPSIDTLDHEVQGIYAPSQKLVVSCFLLSLPFLILSNFNFLEKVHLSSCTEQLLCP